MFVVFWKYMYRVFVVLFLKFRVPHALSNFVKMGTGKYKDWLNKISKILDMNCISIKKHEMEIC